MRFTFRLVVLLLALTAPVESHAQSALTFSARVDLTVAAMAAGGTKWRSRQFLIPSGCRYLSHDFAVIEQVPPRATDLPPNRSVVADRLQRDRNGRVVALSITVGAVRPLFGADGPASIKVQVNVVAECMDGAAEEMARQFT